MHIHRAFAPVRPCAARSSVLDDMVSALEAMHIGVEQYHAESAPGQYEIALTHCPALEVRYTCCTCVLRSLFREEGRMVWYVSASEAKGPSAGSGHQ